MTTRLIPEAILAQHVAVLGKTGSGKTSTAKLAIEQAVADGARVCVLDPIKSDWWGLTSSANGKKAGLPFHILGGPHGHVPLHASAGKAIAEIVANGALPLSIIDMADFEPGGQAKFFIDFAPTLLRKMRGVVYLVIEEAHLFAPKERSGIGAENLSIHWAKTMATAGRSKGVRLVLVTQRTQALHNALLGSCDTLIAHRLTAPADQEPVVKWLKANTSKDVLEQVAGSLASLKTGEGWICSGEAKLFERVSFPRIKTYDNTATPTGDGETREIKTAAVDQEKLRAIIGEAVEIAKADDPKELRRQLAEVKKELAKKEAVLAEVDVRTKRIDEKLGRVKPSPVLTDADRELLTKWSTAITEATRKAEEHIKAAESRADRLVQTAVAEYLNTTRTIGVEIGEQLQMMFDRMGIRKVLEKLSALSLQPSAFAGRRDERTSRAIPAAAPRHGAELGSRVRHSSTPRSAGESTIAPAQQRILNGLAFLHGIGVAQVDKTQLALIVGVSPTSGGYFNNLGSLRSAGLIEYPTGGTVALTDAGHAGASTDGIPATTEELHEAIRAKLPPAKWKILEALIAVHPRSLTKNALAEQIGVSPTSGGYFNNLGSLRSLGLVAYPRASEVVAQPVLFLDGQR